jgi:hypothetical protein
LVSDLSRLLEDLRFFTFSEDFTRLGFCAIGTGALVTRFEFLSLDRDLDFTWDLVVILGARTAPPAEAVFTWA